jgi:plastocyanin
MRSRWWIHRWDERLTQKLQDWEIRRKYMKRVVLALAIALALGLAASAPFVRAALDENATEVKIDNFSFTPSTMSVPVGTQVHWINRDDIPHTVVSEDKAFKSKALDTDDRFSYTFSKPGTYKYFCSLHPKMTAIIVVH